MTGFYIPLLGSGIGILYSLAFIPSLQVAQPVSVSCPTHRAELPNSQLWVVRLCEMFLLFFPRFHRPSQEQAGNGVGSKLHQPTFHLLTVFPYPCGTEAVSDFQAMRKEAAKHKQAIYLKSNDLLGYNHIR